MVAVQNLISEAVSFDFQNFVSEIFDSEAGKRKIAAEKKGLNFAAGSFDVAVVLAYMNFGSDSAIEGVDNSVEVLRILKY